MLVLSRKVGERIVIGHGIVISVQSLSGRRVKLGIEAPTHVTIRRAEIPPDPSAGPQNRGPTTVAAGV